MDCTHCNDLRTRLEPPKTGDWPPGFLLIDGTNSRGHSYLRIPADEIQACDCSCHDTWKWANRGVA